MNNKKVETVIAAVGVCVMVLLIALFFVSGQWHRMNERLAVYGALVGGGRLAGFCLIFGGTVICIGIMNTLTFFAKKAIAWLKGRES